MSLDRYRDEVRITFQTQISTDIDASLQGIDVKMKGMCGPEELVKLSSHPVFGHHHYHHSPDFNFQAELRCLSFPLNNGEAPLDKELQSRFLDIIYDN